MLRNFRQFLESRQCVPVTDARALETQMFDEWKIIQAKIDKIGEFQFHVKNWSWTIAVAIVAGIFAAKLPEPCIFAALIPTWSFRALEARQKAISRLLGSRAFQLERGIDRVAQTYKTPAELALQTTIFGEALRCPGVAYDLAVLGRPRSYGYWKYLHPAFYFSKCQKYFDTTFYIALSLLIVGIALIAIFKPFKLPEQQAAQADISLNSQLQQEIDKFLGDWSATQAAQSAETKEFDLDIRSATREFLERPMPLPKHFSFANLRLRTAKPILSDEHFTLRLNLGEDPTTATSNAK